MKTKNNFIWRSWCLWIYSKYNRQISHLVDKTLPGDDITCTTIVQVKNFQNLWLDRRKKITLEIIYQKWLDTVF